MQKRVLVVDDDVEIAEFIQLYLSEKGYDVASVNSGADALAMLESWRPHLILLDYIMPEMDGLRALELIRERNQDVGVIMITGIDDLELGREALSKGASDYITKPLDLDYLEHSVLVKMRSLLSDLL